MTTATSLTTTQIYRVYIRAAPEAVWDAITNPEWTQRYGYGGRGDYDLRPGGKYVGYTSEDMRAHGAPDIAIEGEILAADPLRRLVQTWQMTMDPSLADEGATRLTYEIDPVESGLTRLTITHELEGKPKLSVLMSGGLEDTGAGGGWAWVLSDLKSLLETGQSLRGGHH